VKDMQSKFLTTVRNIIDAAERPDFFTARDQEPIQLLNAPYMPLVMESWRQEGHGRVIAIAHYFVMNGDVTYDPEIVITEAGEPIGITQWTPAGQVHKNHYHRAGAQEHAGVHAAMGNKPLSAGMD
jgi:hypothetical protein